MAGSFYEVQVRPNADGWSAKLEAQIGAPMRRLAEEFSRRFSEAARDAFDGVGTRLRANLDPAVRGAADNLRDQLRRGIRDGLNPLGNPGTAPGRRQGNDFADAFSREVKTKLERSLRALPEVKIDVNSSAVDREMADIRRKLAASNRAIDLGVDTKLIDARLAELRTRLERLSRDDVDIRVRVNAGTALAELEALKRATDGFGRDTGRGNFLSNGIRSLVSSLRQASPLLDSTVGKLSELSTKVQSVGDSATAGVKSNPITGLIASNAMIAAIAVGLTTIGPLAAAATGAVLGLAGAAAAGALAFNGLRTQMESNVGFGRQIRGEFSGIMTVVDKLSEMVANSVGPGLLSALAQVKAALPSFTGLFKLIGPQLGSVASSLTSAFLNVFQAAQPIIVQVVSYIKTGAERLKEWTGSEGFKTFLAYVMRELPIVGQAIGAVGKLLISAFVAFAPVGEVVLQTLTFIVGLATKVFDVVGNVIGWFSGSSNAKNQDTGPLNAIIQQLQSLGQVTDTVAATSTGFARILGVTDGAYKAANESAAATAAQMAATTLQMQLQNDAAGLLKQSLDALSGKNLGVAQTLNTFQQGLLGLDDTFTKGAFSASEFTDVAVAQRGAIQQLVSGAQAHAQAIADQTGSTTAGTAALRDDIAQIVANTGATGAQRQAVTDYINTLVNLNSLKVPPTKIEADVAEAQLSVQRFSDMVTHLPPGTVSIFADTDSATAAIQRFVSTPRTAYVQVQTLGPTGTSGGRAVFAGGGILDSVPAFAAGGIVDGLRAKLAASVPAFASGTESHVPQIARPGKFARMWAEPETQGEAYIPLANDWRRPKAEAILSDVAKRFGMASAPSSYSVTMSGTAGGTGEMVAEVRALREDVRGVQSAVYAGASHVATDNRAALTDGQRAVAVARAAGTSNMGQVQ